MGDGKRAGRAPGEIEAPERWKLEGADATVWRVADGASLPHGDHIEMSGQFVSLIVRYGVDADGRLRLSRTLVWPTLRTIPNDTHASLSHEYQADMLPRITVDGTPLAPERPTSFRLDGTLTITGETDQGLQVVRALFPTTRHRAALERWTLRNTSGRVLRLAIEAPPQTDLARGTSGVYVLEVSHDAPARARLAPGEQLSFGVSFGGRRLLEAPERLDATREEALRREFVAGVRQSLRLETPDEVLNRAFDFAKLRTTESVFQTRGGLMHCPGGNSYYAAVWTNDQIEYAGPFFPFVGDAAANEASLNAYRLYRPFMGPDYRAIPTSIIAEGADIWEGAGDRGDAAMYAYGAARFALALGDRGIAEELWPAIEWCLEYCRRQMTPDGVIASDSDELEGRFPTGKANLCTSALAYGGLRSAADLARALGRAKAAREYDGRAETLAGAIEAYFGASVEGFDTYRYYEGNDVLRSWICVPLAMGIMDRREGTLAALFSSRLWTPDGLATQAGDKTFWDRSTLYGLRGAFAAGDTERALGLLAAYTHRRLLGEHVPYPVEAYPEGGQRHLAAESALYCRVITEGLFGIAPVGLNAFRCAPRLPEGWERMALRSARAFGRCFDLEVERAGKRLRVVVRCDDRIVLDRRCGPTTDLRVTLP